MCSRYLLFGLVAGISSSLPVLRAPWQRGHSRAPRGSGIQQPPSPAITPEQEAKAFLKSCNAYFFILAWIFIHHQRHTAHVRLSYKRVQKASPTCKR